VSVLLNVEDLKAWYGNTQVLFDVSLTVEEGQVISLMGRNGMGKSTTISSILGMMNHIEGKIEFAGTSIMSIPSHNIAQQGIGLVPEGRRVFPNLSVLENLTAASTIGPWELKQVYNLFPKLEERSKQSASTLSGGEQQMLVIARALMTNPKLLILDEATEGLAPVVRQEIWEAIHKLKAEGISILIVDKTLKELLALSDNCFILERGETIWNGLPSNLTSNIADKYLGV
jgi:branched-chain amino acid transport system ATP-binding protein